MTYVRNIRMNQPTPWVVQKPANKKTKAKLNTAASKLFFPGQQNMGRTMSQTMKKQQTFGVPGKK